MKLLGICAIAVLLFAAIAAEYIESSAGKNAVFVEAELRDPTTSSQTIEEQQVEFLHDLATAAENTAVNASLKSEGEAENIRAELAPLFEEEGWTFQMAHLSGFCDIELRLGRWYVHAWAHKGKGSSEFNFE